MAKEKEKPKTREIEIRPEQTAIVMQMQAEKNAVQERINLLLLGILAGHGITEGNVVSMRGNVLVVETR